MAGENKIIDWKATAAVSIILAALATAVGAEGPGEECVVYVYKLNVLDAPELGDVITALDVGTRVTAWETAEDEYGNAFRRVRAGDVIGWVRADELVPAETYDSTAEKEYVVYTSELGVYDLPNTLDDPKPVAALAAGARFISLAECKGDFNNGYPIFRRVRAGGVEGWVLARYLVPAEEYDPAAEANNLATLGEKYIVAVANLNLYAAPSNSAETLAVLTRRMEVANLSSKLVNAAPEDAGRWELWRQVRAGDQVGWVADEGVMATRFYDSYFRKADELARAGDGAGTVAALKEGKRRELADHSAWQRVENVDEYVAAVVNDSPDQKWVFTEVTFGPDNLDEYPYDMLWPGPGGTIDVGLVFEAGSGLVRYGEIYNGSWAPDSRHFARWGEAVDPYLGLHKFNLLDVDTWEETPLGLISSMEGQGGVEFLNGYLLWLDEQQVVGAPSLPASMWAFTPALVAYNLATGERVRLLKVDVATIPEKMARDKLYYSLYDVVIIPDEPCPPLLKESKLYCRWKGAHAFVLGSSL